MTFTRLIPLAVATLALACAGCTATRTQKSFGETIDDGTITARVKTALVADPATEARNIDVDTRRGVVQLNGFVQSDLGRAQAARVAQNVNGVRAVENNLALKGAERSAGTVLDDGVVTARVKLALAESPATKAFEIKVDTRSGTVQLGGWVDSDAMRIEAGRLASAVDGVTAVDNNLDIKQ
jgi:hyperosmotically inducible periplasmic protein